MAAYAGEKPILLIKKLGGLLLLVGFLLTAVGFSNGWTGLATLGILLLAGGMALLALKFFDAIKAISSDAASGVDLNRGRA